MTEFVNNGKSNVTDSFFPFFSMQQENMKRKDKLDALKLSLSDDSVPEVSVDGVGLPDTAGAASVSDDGSLLEDMALLGFAFADD